jgi:hypothetical protein
MKPQEILFDRHVRKRERRSETDTLSAVSAAADLFFYPNQTAVRRLKRSFLVGHLNAGDAFERHAFTAAGRTQHTRISCSALNRICSLKSGKFFLISTSSAIYMPL